MVLSLKSFALSNNYLHFPQIWTTSSVSRMLLYAAHLRSYRMHFPVVLVLRCVSIFNRVCHWRHHVHQVIYYNNYPNHNSNRLAIVYCTDRLTHFLPSIATQTCLSRSAVCLSVGCLYERT